MSLNQSFNWYQTHRKQNLLSAKSASLELVPETTSNLESYTTDTLGNIQEELNRYRNLYDELPSIIFTLNTDLTILTVNKFGANSLGYEPCDLIKKLFLNLFATSECTRLSNVLNRLLNNSSEELDNWEFHLNCSDSKIEWVKLKARISVDEERNPIIIIICEDITAYKLSQTSRQNENEQSFRELANSLPVMLWMTDEKGLHNFFNHAWLKLTGRKIEKELGWGWLNNLYDEDKDLYIDTYSQALKEKEKFHIEYRLKNAEGDYRWISDTAVPRFALNGDFIGYVGCCIDITECKKAEIAVRESKEAAKAQLEEMESLNRLKDEFLSTVSHELRTPLTNMKMAIQMLNIALKKEQQSFSQAFDSVSCFQKTSKVSRYFEILNNECDREIS